MRCDGGILFSPALFLLSISITLTVFGPLKRSAFGIEIR